MTTPSELLTMLAVAPASTEEHVLQLLIELGAQVVDASEGSLLVYDKVKKDLVFVMTVGGSQTLLGQRVPLNGGLTGLAAATREVQIGAPTFTGVKQASDKSAGGQGPEAVIAAPMLIGDELVGVVTAVSFAHGKRFTARDGELYGRLATVAGVVVEQRRRLNDAVAGAESRTKGGGVEQRLATSIARIAQKQPAGLEQIATILGAIEAMVAPPEHDS